MVPQIKDILTASIYYPPLSQIHFMHRLLSIAFKFAVAIFVATVVSCTDDATTVTSANIQAKGDIPTMSTTNVVTMISDSGYTKYRIDTQQWDIYDETKNPMWIFPKGLHLDNFDKDMNLTATLVCDSATYYSAKRLWRLDGNVVMVNTLRDSFLTEQLFWDQQKAEVYSDSFIHIVRSNHIIEGYGFVSDQSMNSYNVNRPTAIIPINRDRGSTSTKPAIDDAPADAQEPAIGRPTPPEPASVRARRRRDFMLGGADNNDAPAQTPNAEAPAPVAPRNRGTITRRIQ